MRTEKIKQSTLDSLPEYSFSFPTETTLGKVWKCRHGDGWLIGEFVSNPIPGRVGIDWREAEVFGEEVEPHESE